jgi:hypothetical protein
VPVQALRISSEQVNLARSWSREKRFESARRLLFLLANPVKTKSSRSSCRGLVSSTSAVDFPKASSLALACYKWLRGTAGSVSESSGIDRLTDGSGFRRVRHRRKSFARVPRSKGFLEVRTDSYARSCIAPVDYPWTGRGMGFACELAFGASSKVRPRLLRLAPWFVVYTRRAAMKRSPSQRS